MHARKAERDDPRLGIARHARDVRSYILLRYTCAVRPALHGGAMRTRSRRATRYSVGAEPEPVPEAAAEERYAMRLGKKKVFISFIALRRTRTPISIFMPRVQCLSTHYGVVSLLYVWKRKCG